MSIFASATQQTRPIPTDPDQTVTIRKLSGTEYDAAQFAHMTGVVTGRGRNWATRFIHIAAAGTATEADARKVLSDPLSGFDRVSIVRGGLVGWSYQVEDKPKPVTPEAINDLDDETLEWLATEILTLTKPALFHASDEDAEIARKNG